VVGSRDCGKNRRPCPIGSRARVWFEHSFTALLYMYIIFDQQKRASVTIDPLVLTRRIVVANQVGSTQSGSFLVIENIAFPTDHLISICFEWSDRRVIALRTISLFHLLGRRSFAVVVDYST
jgi:hypothetical protein